MRQATGLSETKRDARRRGASTVLALAVGSAILAPSLARADGSTLPPEVGYNYGQTETPRIAAMGGALRAFSSSTDALFINPANMATSRVYHVGALAQIWPEASRQSYGLGIVDSIVSASRLAGGLGGTWTRQDPSGVDRTSYDLRFALAFPFSEHFFLGASGRYLSMKQGGFPSGLFSLRPSTAAGGLNDKAIVQNITFDAGMTLKPIPELSFSIVGANLTDPGHGFLPLTFGGGVAYGTRDFTVEGDALADFTTYGGTTPASGSSPTKANIRCEEVCARAMLGGEYLAADHFPLRAGYRYDQGMQSHALTGGFGYVDTAYELDLALQRVVVGDRATAIIIGFKYHVESGGLTPEGD